MDKLRAMRLFVRLADLGSFTRVAEHTNTSKSMISREISRLEDALGVRLLHRSTRNVQLTHVGQGYLQQVREILEKINATMTLGITDLSALCAGFMQTYPDIELDIHLGDENVDLVEHGFDLGFRISYRPIDSAYVGRPLSHFNFRVCVGPD
jgi:DNA-binding transcriptional LysR family regulator